MTKVQSSWLPALSLLGAMVLYGSSFIALKLAFQSYDPMVVIFGRMAVAGLCFLLFLKRFGKNVYRKGDFKYLLFMAFCEPCMYFVFEAHAVENTTASQAGMITAMLPIMVAVGARFFLHEQISRKTMAGLLLAIVGVCWLSLDSVASRTAPHPWLGNFLEVMAMVCATGYTIALKRLSARYHPFFLTAVQAWVGSLFFLPFLLLPGTHLPSRFVAVPALSIIYLGVFVTLLAYALYNFGVSRIPANQATSYVNLVPVFAVLLGWLILDEHFRPMQYLASSLVFVGVILSQQKQPRSASVENCTAAHLAN
jgi:drug/metabolite transporter (DMT)-like permease